MTFPVDPVRCPHRSLVLGTTQDPDFRAWVERELPRATPLDDPVDVMVELALRTRAELKRRAWGLTPAAPAALLFPRVVPDRSTTDLNLQPLLAAVLRYLPDTALYRWDDGAIKRLGGPDPTQSDVAPPPPPTARAATAPRPRVADLRLVAETPPPLPDARVADEDDAPVLVPEISPEEIAMLLGADETPAP